MSFIYHRTIRFQDTDAAGVVFFANTLAICHEAYEASLAEVGVNLTQFFRGTELAIPIVHASVDFLRPVFCGDQQIVHLSPTPLSPDTFEIHYAIASAADPQCLMSKALTQHVCIEPTHRQRQPLPGIMQTWLRRWGKSSASV